MDPRRDICGFAQREMDLLRAGNGDRALGRLRLAERELAALDPAASEEQRGRALWELGEAKYHVGDADGAELHWARALALPGWRSSRSWAHRRRSHTLTLLWAGQLARAEPFAREDVDHLRDTDETEWLSALSTLAEILLGLDNHVDARPVIEEMLVWFRDVGHAKNYVIGHELVAKRRLASVHAARGDLESALAWIDDAEHQSAGWPHEERARILMASAELRRRAGRDQEAHERALAARDWYAQYIDGRAARGMKSSDAERERDAFLARWPFL